MLNKYSEPTNEILRTETDAFLHTTNFAKTEIDETVETVTGTDQLRPHCVNIPVAAHQDSQLIYHALSQYAKQKNSRPISTILHLNAPVTEPTSVFDVAHDTITRAKKDFPELDIRSFQTQYEHPRIGKIRSDLWKTTIKTALEDKSITPTNDVIGYNHDIDLEYLPDNYFAAVEKWYDKRRKNFALINAALDLPADRCIILPYSFTRVRHATRFETHPNSSAVIAWSDLMTRLQNNSFEAALITPFSRYAKSGGFKNTDTTMETRAITNGEKDGLQPDEYIVPSLPLVTSPRRYLERLHHGGIESVWEEGTFGATDACRSTQTPPDISREQAHKHIERSINDTYTMTANAAVLRRISKSLKRHRYEYIHKPGDFPTTAPEEEQFAVLEDIRLRLIERTNQIAIRALKSYLGSDTISLKHLINELPIT